MKKFLQNILALVVFTTTTIHASAYDFEVDGIYYNILQDENSVEVTKNGDNYYIGDIVIPEQVTYNGNTYDVTSIGGEAFWFCSSLSSIEIPNSVTSIGYNAFYSCINLISIKIPTSVISIGKHAFCNCSSLTSVDIPHSVTSIGESAFCKCSSLTSVKIPDTVTSIGYSTFSECSSLTSIEIPNSVTEIGKSAFAGCSSLTSIEIPNSVTSIGWNAFSYCSSLYSIEIPNSVTKIDYDAFYDCSSLTSIYYNSDILVVGDDRIFEQDVYDQATLYLTDAGFAMSNDVSPWKNFKHKEVYQFSDIKNVEAVSYNTAVEYYNLNGVRSNSDALTPGLYIRKQGNTTAKVLVK